jgi:hypothetical protein
LGTNNYDLLKTALAITFDGKYKGFDISQEYFLWQNLSMATKSLDFLP